MNCFPIFEKAEFSPQIPVGIFTLAWISPLKHLRELGANYLEYLSANEEFHFIGGEGASHRVTGIS